MQPQSIPNVEGPAAARTGRVRSAWRAAHEPAPGVSRRIQLIAYAVPLAVLPSSVWRLPIVFDTGKGVGERVYVVLLSFLSEALAFTAIGLIARWGEVFPRWIPVLRGRRVPPNAAVLPAAVGAVFLTSVFSVVSTVAQIRGTTIQGGDLPADAPGRYTGWESVWFHLCYTPLIVWGPLLAVLTVAYRGRRREA
ncbi:hypothetical protein [Embleya scabrispora]|uniref:hypothetical protein n=1 Tax=Embleya scabrispora TaxID=159449 RepID=UPI0003788E25|nr:hypothetical protein [Embleya scabrispora]MYS81561.1 hypothetical protein [Streptomyces sp. SID5474]